MANGVEEIITTLYEMVQDAWSLPLGAEKCVIERSMRSAISFPVS